MHWKSYRSGIVIGSVLCLVVLLFGLDYQFLNVIGNDNARLSLLISISLSIVHILIFYNTYQYKRELNEAMLKYNLEQAGDDLKNVLRRFERSSICFTFSQILSVIIIALSWLMVIKVADVYNLRPYVGPVLDFITVLIFVLFYIGDGILVQVKNELVIQLEKRLQESSESVDISKKLLNAKANKTYVERQRAFISLPGLLVMISIFICSLIFMIYPHYTSELTNPKNNGIFPEGFSFGATILHLLFTQLIFGHLEFSYNEELKLIPQA